MKYDDGCIHKKIYMHNNYDNDNSNCNKSTTQLQEAGGIPDERDEPFKLNGVNINSLFQYRNLMRLSA